MLNVSSDIERIIIGNNRVYKAKVGFSFLSCKIPETILIKAPNAHKGSVTDQIVYPYLSHVQDRFFMSQELPRRLFPFEPLIHADGKAHRVSKKPYAHIGYIGRKADAHGNVDDTITLYIPKTELKRITIRTNPDRIIIDAVLRAMDMKGNVIQETVIKHNSAHEIIAALPCKNAHSISLAVQKHTPTKRLWILSFYPGFEFLINESDIESLKLIRRKTENKEGSIGRLYINSLSLSLNNLDRIYDAKNTKSPVAGYFNSNAIVYAHLVLQNKGGDNLTIDLGRYFVSDIKNDESKPIVTIEAQDYIGTQKDKHLALGIADETNAYECFMKIANALNISGSTIDLSLKRIALRRYPLNGKVSSLLNDLCILTNTFASIDRAGNNLTVAPIKARHGAIRYPLRFFALDEYNQSAQAEATKAFPNILHLSYSNYEYEGEYQAGYKDSILYSVIGRSAFPDVYTNVPYGTYPIGGALAANFTKEYTLPNNFVTVELSDPFIPKLLEYDTTYFEISGVKKVRVRIWNFADRTEGEQITIALMVMEKPREVLLKKEDFVAARTPQSYIKPVLDSDLNHADYDAVCARNEKNEPVEFSVLIKDAVKLDKVEIGNIFTQSFFEFAYKKTEDGIAVKVWNYSGKEQTVSVKLYGSRLVHGKEKKVIHARNEDDIQINGEIEKTIDVGALASDAVAEDVLRTMAYYYHKFQNDLSVQLWSDPRIALYDLVAFKSLRGYGYTQGIVDELELEFKGFLTQKLKIKQTLHHNRDSRVAGGMVYRDRPVMRTIGTGYA